MPTAVAFKRKDVLKTSFAFRPWSPRAIASARRCTQREGGEPLAK